MQTSLSHNADVERNLPPTLARSDSGRDRRTHGRSAVPHSVQLRTRGRRTRSRERSGTLLHWSPKGGRIEIPHALEGGEWLDLRFPRSSAAHLPDDFPANRPISAQVVAKAAVDTRAQAGYAYGLKFHVGKDRRRLRFLDRCITCLAFSAFVAIFANVCYLKAYNINYFWYSPLANFYSLVISCYILSRFVLSVFYRPPRDVGYLPTVSAVIACKNEEVSIARTLECIYQSDYPKDRLEVIVVNDGSTDNTLSEMQRTKARHPDLQIIDFETNLGKRHGMAAGARRARGQILLYVDSDSFVRPDAVRQMVQGFADAEVGAVCGHADVQNAHQNMLTKMQEVRYFVAFRVVKAAESLFSTVACCSGCLAAYRRSYLMPILDEWLNQSFLGTPATFGDDRSLTNYMLRRYRVIYNSKAIATTIVPDSYRKFFKQQLRWKKSWVRETFIASGFMWRRHPVAAFFYYLGGIFPVISPIVAFNALVLPLISPRHVSFLYIYGALLMATLYGLYYLWQHRNWLWVYGIVFSFFYMFVLVWQTYYALLTVRRNHWGTR
jgi:hyaluronan synthase